MQLCRICAKKAAVFSFGPRVFSTVTTLFDTHDFRMAHRSLYPDSTENVNEKPASNQTRPTKTPFGTRYLTDPEKVFEHNAWQVESMETYSIICVLFRPDCFFTSSSSAVTIST